MVKAIQSLSSLASYRSLCQTILLVYMLVVTLHTSEASPRSSYALYHRLGPGSTTSTNLSSTEWQKRALLEIESSDSNNLPRAQDPVQFKVSSFTKLSPSLQIPESASFHDWVYQISLVPADSPPLPGQLPHSLTGSPISSFPLCALMMEPSESKEGPIQEYINIWIRSSLTEKMSDNNLELDLLGLQWSSSLSKSTSVTCESLDPKSPKIDQDSLLRSKVNKLIQNQGQSNIKLSVRNPEVLEEPILTPYPIQKPPEFLADGTVKPPVAEKGWLSKYWMYILPVVVMLLVGRGPPPEESTEQQAPPAGKK
ncbi:hypothetical protein PSTT_01085 [Puccinia striiformis]|uniref:Uncharacterized protein n=1 Tax=Puccinia striiformis TaxID=27350 RepID=A0A2S4W4H7_9BASI|nr:hypothetical protein PSTT_01085 [Puccinia striiformis]